MRDDILSQIIERNEHVYDIVFGGVDLKTHDAEDPPYDQMVDKKGLKLFMEAKLENYNDEMKGRAMDIVLFKDAIEHCLKILRLGLCVSAIVMRWLCNSLRVASPG